MTDLTDNEIAQLRLRRVLDSQCDICCADAAVIHEISRGIDREKSLLARYATLALCSPCHDRVHQGMSRAEQLAWLKARRPGDFDLAAFWELTGRRFPSAREVWLAYRPLMDRLLRS